MFDEENYNPKPDHSSQDDSYSQAISEQIIKTDKERMKIRKNLEKMLEEKRMKDEDGFL